MEKKLIELPVGNIKIEIYYDKNDEKLVSGTVTSSLKEFEDDNEYNAAMDGIESLLLALACAGVDITAPAFIKSIEV